MSMNVNKKSGRPRLLPKEELAAIMFAIFASKGYEATSLNDLTQATGTKPATLYQAFGNKEGMFIAALEHYKAAWLADLEVILSSDALSFNNKIKQFLFSAFNLFSCEGKPPGCLLVFSALSFRPEASSLGTKLFNERNAFKAWIIEEAQRAQQNNSLSSTLSPEEVAEFILTFESGLALMALDNPDQKVISAMIDKMIDAVMPC
ncbi:TetR/AcrR family transcriptional regulator [Pantoea sp. B9002]|jgi:AcrR family transcriptional regulator|nr:TetR/AcrR family transcriptional regulator [Pantoea sp. B9002]